MDSLDLIDVSAELRLAMISQYLELALLGILVACVWTIYRYITKTVLLSLVFAACALSVELIFYILLNAKSIAFYIERGTFYYTLFNWLSHLVYSLASLSVITLIINSALSEQKGRSSEDKTAINQ